MAQVQTGTVSITNNTNVVTGTGTQFQSENVEAGDKFFIVGSPAVAISVQTVGSETGLTLAANWTGGDVVAGSYRISVDFTARLGFALVSRGDINAGAILSGNWTFLDNYLGDLSDRAQLAVKDRNLTTPPGSPSTGDLYIPAATASGDWLGQEDKIARWDGTAWTFQTPVEGWTAWVNDEDILIAFSGASWSAVSGNPFDQSLNTTDSPTFTKITIPNDDAIEIAASTPTITLRDTDGLSAFWHNNGGSLFLLRGELNTGYNGWTPVGGLWPLQISLSNNDATFGGRLGVGKTPAFPLDVVTGGAGNSRLVSNTPAGLNLRITDETSTDRDLAGVNFGIGSTASADFQGFLTLSTTPAAGALTERLRILQDGRIGIGTNSPTGRLQSLTGVNGEFAFVANHTDAANDNPVIYGTSARPSGSAATNLLTLASNNGADNEFRFDGAGNGFADGSFTGGGADYAEYFEWLDGNPDDEDRAGWSVVLEDGKIRRALPDEIPFGVMSVNPSVVGDAAWSRWSGKYLRDDFARYLKEDYVVVSWTGTEVTYEELEIEDYEEEVVGQETKIFFENGKAIQKVVDSVKRVPKVELHPVFMEDGEPVLERVEHVLTEEEKKAGVPSFSYEQAKFTVPVMKTVKKRIETSKEYSFAEDEVPEDLVVPEDAERVVQQRRVLNPKYDPSVPYTPREERPEWDTIGMMGKLRVLKGEQVAPHWIKMRDISDLVEEWLIKAG